MSQAVVRRHDRRRFKNMFISFGLPPGYQLNPTDMVRLLDGWIRQNPTPVSRSLRDLWERDPSIRDRVAIVASIELEAWDGSGSQEGGTVLPVELRLLALLRTFMGRRLELSLLLKGRTPVPQTLELEGTQTHITQSLEFVPAANGSLRLAEPDMVEAESLLGVPLQVGGDQGHRPASRQPRRLVPLRKDELVQAFVEAERVQLGEDSMLLCKSELAWPVAQALDKVARRGWKQHDEGVDGLPPGWTLFTDVQVLSILDTSRQRMELNILVPIATSQLALSGGLQLPGRMRKWLTYAPPEVRGLLERAPNVTVTLDQLRTFTGQQFEPRQWISESAAVVINLEEEDLPDGDYQIALSEGPGKAPSTQTLLRLRSAESVARELWVQRPRLVHHLDAGSSLAGISAAAFIDGSVYVEGGQVVGHAPSSADRSPVQLPDKLDAVDHGRTPRQRSRRAPISLGAPDPQSCVITGQHRMELPPMLTARPTPGTLEGRCESCGLVKRYPATHWQAAKRRVKAKKAAEISDRIDLTQVHPIGDHSAVPWDDAFDAVCHVGGGPIGHLERIALQLEGSTLFVMNFLRHLEYLGHIDVERDPSSLAPVRWELAPPVLAELPHQGAFVMSGYRNSGVVVRLGHAVTEQGGELHRRKQPEGPDVITVSGLPREKLAEVVEDVGPVTDTHGLAVAARAAYALAECAPPLSAIKRALPRAPLPHWRSAEMWEPDTARWAPCETVSYPGIYRLHGYATVYGFRSEEDLEAGTITLSTVHALKHVAALMHRKPLIAFHESTGSVITPLGCDLPGLYGRALVLCSGELPVVHKKERMLQYRTVPREIAQALLDRLMS